MNGRHRRTREDDEPPGFSWSRLARAVAGGLGRGLLLEAGREIWRALTGNGEGPGPLSH